jgi:S-adenosylmethionine synthetase
VEIEKIPVRQQATVFGFACRQSDVLIPLPIWLAHKLARQIIQAQRNKSIPYLSLVVSSAVDYQVSPHRLHDDIREAVILPAFSEEAIRPDE